MEKLWTGVAYHGNRILRHVEDDMRDIVNHNMNLVVHMFTHNDWDRHLKVMKDIVTQYYGISDFVIGSPKEVLKKAFQTRLIEDERAWLEMHELRNRIAHTYEETELAVIFHLIVGSYIDKMQELQKLIDSLPMLLEE